jgi:Xaa-Pro dipeptidase
LTGRSSACECPRIETTFGITEPALDDRRATEVEGKLAAVRAVLARRELPAVAMGRTDAVAWITGGLTNRIEAGNPASAAWVVVTPEAAHVVTTNVELPRLSAEGGLDGFELHGVDWYEPAGFARLAEQIAGAPVERIGGLGIDVDDELIELRLSLDPAEQERLAGLAVDATVALESSLRQWVPGGLDVETQARVAAALEATGAFGACLIVGGDDRVERFRHPLAAAKPVHRLLMAVVVAERRGLHAAATRFASAGSLQDSVRAAHRAAADVERAVLDASRPSATYGDALLALADAYANNGYAEEWRDHYQGGPIGYRQREFEIVPSQVESRWFTTPISPGTALAWNPSVVGGGKCEDTYLVEEHGLRRLTDTGDWPLEDGRPAILDLVSGEAA